MDLNWVQMKLKEILQLWQDALNKETVSYPSYSEFLNDLHAKRKLMMSIRGFLTNCQKLLTENISKFITTIIFNFFLSFIGIDDSKLSFKIVRDSSDVLLCKLVLFSPF